MPGYFTLIAKCQRLSSGTAPLRALIRPLSYASGTSVRTQDYALLQLHFRFSQLPGRVNIASPSGPVPRTGKKGCPVLLYCTEEGCDWREVGTKLTAQKHASAAHEGRRLHFYTPKPEEELRAVQRSERRDVNRRWRQRQRQQQQAQVRMGRPPPVKFLSPSPSLHTAIPIGI
jgi:hypothetical protein